MLHWEAAVTNKLESLLYFVNILNNEGLHVLTDYITL